MAARGRGAAAGCIGRGVSVVKGNVTPELRSLLNFQQNPAMKATRLLPIISPLLFWSCAATEQARLQTLPSFRYQNNWDEILITKVDGRRMTPPKEEVTLGAGNHTVTFSISYMKEDLQRPILAEVSVTADFAAGHKYRAMSRYHWGFMGAMIDEPDHPSNEPAITGATLVWSPEFHAHSEKWNRLMKSKAKQVH